MPEGDTLFNTALTLRPALLGESLTAVNVRARCMYRLRVGDTVRSVEAIGKFLEIVVERGLALRTHLHMTGVWHLYETAAEQLQANLGRWKRQTAAAVADYSWLIASRTFRRAARRAGRIAATMPASPAITR